MQLKRYITLALAGLMGAALLTSCAPKEPFSAKFIKDEGSAEYSSAVEGSALTIYVDGNAAEGGNGTETAPFKTIPEAQAKIRELKSGEGLPAGGITVLVKDGEYRLTESISLTEEDSGTAECPITYVSETEHGAVLTGGLILSAKDFEPLTEEEKSKLVEETARDKVVKVDLTKYGVAAENLEVIGNSAMELFIDGERSSLARYPNDDFTKTVRVIDVGDTHETFTDINFDGRGEAYVIPGFSYDVNNRGGTFTVLDAVKERIAKWSSHEDIYAQGYFKWSWSASTTLIGSFNEDGSITMSKAITYGLSQGAPFYFLNVYDEIDMPGEFFLDKANGVLYVYKTDSFDNAEIMISELNANLFNISNANHITVKGFGLCATRADGMRVSGTYLTVDNCKFYNIRNSALSASGTNITVQNCDISKMGSGGISVSGGDPATLTGSNNLVYNNYIHEWGIINRTYQTAISVGGCGATVSHNEMCIAPHMAVGWSGPNHIFEYNEVYDVCFETSDCGAFYGGRNLNSYGCIIRYNYIHDVGSGSAGKHAIYWDDGLSGQTAYGNLIVNTSGLGVHAGGGRDNVIENNLFINCGESPISYDIRTREEILYDDCWFTHDEELANGLYRNNEAWNTAFPGYGNIIPYYNGYEGDVNDPMLSANPAKNVVKNNIAYIFDLGDMDLRNAQRKFNINDYIYEQSEVKNNFILTDNITDIPGIHNENYAFRNGAYAKEICPEFKELPLDKMGRNN